VPTWRGWLALLLALGLPAIAALRGAAAFLTIHDPAPGGVLVVEGWVSPGDARDVLAEAGRRHYSDIYVTGGPIEAESPLASFGSYAELTADVFRRVGADAAKIHAIPGPRVAKDRTYSSALALKAALLAEKTPPASLNLVTAASHSRRSRLLFEKAFGPGTRIGAIALPEREFDPARWWTTSAGFRTIVGELIAYLYARFLFHPGAA